MDYQQLSNRLEAVAKLVPQGSFLADIGSDHAYLPAHLILNHQITGAIAGEVVKGPYESAEKLVNDLLLTDKIDVRLGDGLEVIKPYDNVSAITICGMGGTLIRDILERGKNKNRLTRKELLILQPNVGSHVLRHWLVENHYIIQDEKILSENDKTYEIIVAEASDRKVELTESEELFGPVLMKESSDVFKAKWQFELEQYERVINQLSQSKTNQDKKIAQINHQCDLIKEVLS
ncbi:SAM-dependent methyltransferase [Vagococcus martis]|uniref:SAM-dependent methyltransferase n=1 Tax=Vagococcus martis TaxID=1768210 RepID=A0A1V4DJZ5_9ENTE|nr:tRNA (adenine(22)-N(1))-methyltransferase TrmK [Vagococcus martis]OPF88742.1 SAM-dependent methyltransferase [Vagococcus martis]